MRGVALVVLIFGLFVAGCGGGTTTVIKKTVVSRTTSTATTSSSTATTSTSAARPGEQMCAKLPPNFPGGPPNVVYAKKLDCATANRLARQASTGPLPSEWQCAASTITCENSATGSSFRVDDNTPPGEQFCPKGLVAVGDDACGPPPAKNCNPYEAAAPTPRRLGVYGMKVQNLSCAEALVVAEQAAECQPHVCEGTMIGFRCRSHRVGVKCDGPHYKVVMWKPGFYGAEPSDP